MDERYLKVFELCFQSKSEARKQKEAGEAVGSSGVEQRRKMLKIQGTRRVGSTTRRVSSKIREDKESVTYRVRELRGGLGESVRIYKNSCPDRHSIFWNPWGEASCESEPGEI